jgi:hypothetical protein
MRKVFLSASATIGLVMAQEPAAATHDVVTFSAPIAASRNLAFVSAEWVGPGGTIKGKPYSAETTTESVQTLADGNRIVHKNTSSFYRDSEGRTRREMNIEVPGHPEESHKMIMIDDPVAGVHYNLNSKEKTAMKIPMPQAPQGADVATFRSYAGTRVAGAPAIAAAPTIAMGATSGFARSGVMMARKPVQAGEAPQTEQLGKQVMEGVEATGTLTTFTIPAGQMGNDRPIVSKSETWLSEELGTPILMKSSDPRFGETTSRTTNIRRTEPARDLFEVPSDYRIEEPQAFKERMMTTKPPEEL